MRKPFFRSTGTAWAIGAALIIAGSWCFHDAYSRRGKNAPWAVKLLTPGM